MLSFKKLLFNGQCAVLEDTTKILNNQVIMNLQTNQISQEGYWNVEESIGDYTIISKRYRAYLSADKIYYGIIDSSLKTIIDPEKNNYQNSNGLSKVKEILTEIIKMDPSKEKEYGENLQLARKKSTSLSI